MSGQASLDGIGGRTVAAPVALVAGEYVSAAPMPAAPSVRLMVLATSASTVEAAPHSGGDVVTVCTRGACAASTSRAGACARRGGVWHPIPAPAADGLF